MLGREGHQPLRGAAGRAVARRRKTELVFYAFDLVRLDGWNLTAAPLAEAQGAAAAAAGRRRPGARRSSSATTSPAAGRRSTTRCRTLGLEGVVSKRASAPYQPGRSKTWTKAKAKLTGDFVIAGYTVVGGGRRAWRRWRSANGSTASCSYRGKVGTGFDAGDARRPPTRGWRRCEDRSAGAGRARRSDIRWVRPVLSARIHYSNITADNAVRHAVFMGLREVALARRGAGAADAADLRGRPRHGLGHQPDAAAVRPVGADQARRRGLLRGDRRLHAAAHLRPAGVAGALPDRPAAGLLLPAPRLPRHAGRRRRASRSDQHRGRDQDLPHRRDGQGLPGAGAVRRRRVPRLGLPRASSSRRPTGSSSTSTPARASPGARWSRRRCTCAASSRRSGSCRLRQDHRRQGRARGGAGHAEARLEGGAPGDERARRARSPRPRPTPSPPSWERRTASAGSSSTSTATPAARPRWRPIRCARATICRHLRRSAGKISRSIDAPEDLNYSSLPGLVAASGDPWADIDDFATGPAGAEARQGSRTAAGEDHGAAGQAGRDI